MKAPTTAQARERLATGYALDQLWGETMGLVARVQDVRRRLLSAGLDGRVSG
ncbi:MAG: hypothetical protein Q7R30_01120 [Acidobacteriota bacterium]|nr:hypothetical protein [Acidobacteriota bacterium]